MKTEDKKKIKKHEECCDTQQAKDKKLGKWVMRQMLRTSKGYEKEKEYKKSNNHK